MISAQCMSQSVGTASSLGTTFFQVLLASFCSISSPDIWPRDIGEDAVNYGLAEYDFVIIGAGSAGSVVANRLSADSGKRVLVIEAGGDPPMESEIPLYSNTMRNSDYTWNYKTEPSKKYCLGYVNNSCNLPRGKMLGGSGATNGMIYLRGNRGDFDLWKRNGNLDWGWEEVLPYFKKSMSSWNDAGLYLNHFTYKHPLSSIVLEAAKETGKLFYEDYLDTESAGYTYVWATQKDGRRMSTGKTYLAAAKYRDNLDVIKHAVVKRINFKEDGITAESVTFVYKGDQELTVNATKEIVLSAGAIDSPKLLMLSGVGPKNQLTRHKVKVVKDLPVGKNLQDHFSVLMFFKFNKSAFNLTDPLDDFYNYLRNGSGTLGGIGTLSLVGLINTDPSSRYPSIGLYHVPHANMKMSITVHGIKPEYMAEHMNVDNEHYVMKVLVCLMRPKSLGKIELRSDNYKDSSKIFVNYLSEKYDIDQTLKGVKYQMSLLNTTVFRAHNFQFMKPKIPECEAKSFGSDSYWKCFIKYMGTTIHHPIGSNKMGPYTDKTSVVDETLKVKGLNGLRVVDASVMPHMVSANVNAATIMIAEKASDIIIEDWK